MSTFTPWTLFVDVGLISILLLLGKLIRVKVVWIQKLFIPPSLLAGFMGLALGPNGFDVIPLSNSIGTYAGILIAFVFGSLPLSAPKQNKKEISGRIGAMWAFSQSGMLLQWALGGFFGILVLSVLWNLEPWFGIMLSSGFTGGHGTAAAVGQAFDTLGFEDARSLAMTSATVGIVASIIGGLAMIRWATSRNHTKYITGFSDLPNELRTGLLPEDKRESIGRTTCSSISIDPLALNLIAVTIVAFGGYMLSQGISSFFPKLELPVFSCAFIVGLILKKIGDRTKASDYICPQTVNRISGTFTDFLVAFGVASIKLEVVMQYAVPLILLLVFGIVFTASYVLYVGRRMMKESWFEKSLFTWGWFTGTMAMGIAMLRIIDPKMESKALDDYALAYLPIAPVEICLITFAPIAFVNGYGFLFLGVCLVGGLGILLTAKLKGWWSPVKKK